MQSLGKDILKLVQDDVFVQVLFFENRNL